MAIDADIEGLVRDGAIAPAGERLLAQYGDEVYGLLLQLLGEAEAGEVYAKLSGELRATLPAFTFWCTWRTLVYRLARRAARARRAPAAALTTQVQRKLPDERVVAARRSLDADDRILLTLRVDRAFTWDDLARVMLDADAPDADTIAREGERLRERFATLKGELQQQRFAAASTAPPTDAQTLEDRVGATIGNYRIVDLLGGGGMGVVWRAEHTTRGHAAVIKLIQDELVADGAHSRRFSLEAKTAASIRHPGIVEVFEHGEHRGRAYIAMEFLAGESLRARLEREPKLPIELALDIAGQTAAAVGAAHAAGVIHRDLKPDNLFLVPDANQPHGVRVKVLDFGLAKMIASTEPGITKTGNLVGTPRYMSPEQCRLGATVDGRADIYSLGCILFEIVCGRVPFLDRTVGDLVIAHSSLVPPAPSSLASEIRPALDRAILRALAKQAGERYATMEAFAETLAQLANSTPLHALAETQPARPVPVAVAPPPPAEPPRRPYPYLRLVGLALAIVTSVVVIGLLVR